MDMSIGTVKIADDVVAQIASIAATEIDGVSAISGKNARDFLNKATKNATNKGAKASIDKQEVSIDLSMSMGYGYVIPTTCEQVQKRVREVVENMTGLTVKDVNVRIADVTLPQA